MRVIFKTTLLAVAVALLVLGGCGGGGGGDDELLALQGLVLDDGTLTPVSNAQVLTNTGQSSITNSAGRFTVYGVSGQAQTLTVAAPDFQTATAPISRVGGGLVVDTVYLRPAPQQGHGHITGTVTEGGQAAGGANLQAGGQQAVSKSDGTYTLYNVPVGAQTVMALSSNGLSSGSAAATVGDRTTVTRNITLGNSPPPPPPL